jgi:hypothetical protein
MLIESELVKRSVAATHLDRTLKAKIAGSNPARATTILKLDKALLRTAGC